MDKKEICFHNLCRFLTNDCLIPNLCGNSKEKRKIFIPYFKILSNNFRKFDNETRKQIVTQHMNPLSYQDFTFVDLIEKIVPIDKKSKSKTISPNDLIRDNSQTISIDKKIDFNFLPRDIDFDVSYDKVKFNNPQMNISTSDRMVESGGRGENMFTNLPRANNFYSSYPARSSIHYAREGNDCSENVGRTDKPPILSSASYILSYLPTEYRDKITPLFWAVTCDLPHEIIRFLIVDCAADTDQMCYWNWREACTWESERFTLPNLISGRGPPATFASILQNRCQQQVQANHGANKSVEEVPNEVIDSSSQQLLLNNVTTGVNYNNYYSINPNRSLLTQDYAPDLPNLHSTVQLITPLWAAAVLGRLRTIRILITQGHANVNTQSAITGSTALRSCCFMSRKGVVRYLLSQSANPWLANHVGGTPLINSVQSIVITRMLIDNCLLDFYRANSKQSLRNHELSHDVDLDNNNQRSDEEIRRIFVNQVDVQGKSALHYAAQEGRIHTAKLLLQCGADPNLKNKFGNTFWETCAIYGSADLIQMAAQFFKFIRMLPSIDDSGSESIEINLFPEPINEFSCYLNGTVNYQTQIRELISLDPLIQAYYLLGTTLLEDTDDVSQAVFFWREALKRQKAYVQYLKQSWCLSQSFEYKPTKTPIFNCLSFLGSYEFSCTEELDIVAFGNDLSLPYLQSALITERILGCTHEVTQSRLMRCGFKLLSLNSPPYIPFNLWSYVLESRSSNITDFDDQNVYDLTAIANYVFELENRHRSRGRGISPSPNTNDYRRVSTVAAAFSLLLPYNHSSYYDGNDSALFSPSDGTLHPSLSYYVTEIFGHVNSVTRNRVPLNGLLRLLTVICTEMIPRMIRFINAPGHAAASLNTSLNHSPTPPNHSLFNGPVYFMHLKNLKGILRCTIKLFYCAHCLLTDNLGSEEFPVDGPHPSGTRPNLWYNGVAAMTSAVENITDITPTDTTNSASGTSPDSRILKFTDHGLLSLLEILNTCMQGELGYYLDGSHLLHYVMEFAATFHVTEQRRFSPPLYHLLEPLPFLEWILKGSHPYYIFKPLLNQPNHKGVLPLHVVPLMNPEVFRLRSITTSTRAVHFDSSTRYENVCYLSKLIKLLTRHGAHVDCLFVRSLPFKRQSFDHSSTLRVKENTAEDNFNNTILKNTHLSNFFKHDNKIFPLSCLAATAFIKRNDLALITTVKNDRCNESIKQLIEVHTSSPFNNSTL